MNIVRRAISRANAISISKLMKPIFRFNSYSNLIEKHILEVLVGGTASLFIILVTVI